nr:unnamed protein product [Spirometra erinaceieuropaei]
MGAPGGVSNLGTLLSLVNLTAGPSGGGGSVADAASFFYLPPVPVVDSHSGYVASLASAFTCILATAWYGMHVCPASICLAAIHCLHHASGRYSACTMRGSEPIAIAYYL